LHRQTSPYPGFRFSGVQNASVVLIFVSAKTHPSRILFLRCLKCKRGAHFSIAKHTLIEDFASWASGMRARRSFSHRQTHQYQGFRVPGVEYVSMVLVFSLPDATLSRISLPGGPKCKRGAPFRICKIQACQGFRPWGVQNASVLPIFFASPNVSPSRISPLRSPKCNHGGHFRIAEQPLIEDFASRASKLRAWCSSSHRQTHP